MWGSFAETQRALLLKTNSLFVRAPFEESARALTPLHSSVALLQKGGDPFAEIHQGLLLKCKTLFVGAARWSTLELCVCICHCVVFFRHSRTVCVCVCVCACVCV